MILPDRPDFDDAPAWERALAAAAVLLGAVIGTIVCAICAGILAGLVVFGYRLVIPVVPCERSFTP